MFPFTFIYSLQFWQVWLWDYSNYKISTLTFFFTDIITYCIDHIDGPIHPYYIYKTFFLLLRDCTPDSVVRRNMQCTEKKWSTKAGGIQFVAIHIMIPSLLQSVERSHGIRITALALNPSGRPVIRATDRGDRCSDLFLQILLGFKWPVHVHVSKCGCLSPPQILSLPFAPGFTLNWLRGRAEHAIQYETWRKGSWKKLLTIFEIWMWTLGAVPVYDLAFLLRKLRVIQKQKLRDYLHITI